MASSVELQVKRVGVDGVMSNNQKFSLLSYKDQQLMFVVITVCYMYISGYSPRQICRSLYTLSDDGNDHHFSDHIVRDVLRDLFINSATAGACVFPILNQFCTIFK